MAVSGSITIEKESYHIVLNNYIIKNIEDRDYIKNIVQYLNNTYDDSFDWKVYTNNRNMKAINQSKADGRVQNIIINDDPTKHLITCFFNNIFHELPKFDDINNEDLSLAIKIEKSKKIFDLASLPKLKILEIPEDYINRINELTPLEILSLLPISTLFDHNYTHLVARFCYYNNITFNDFLSWYQKKNNSIESINKWDKHWKKLDKFPNVSICRIIKLLTKYYPKIKLANYKISASKNDIDEHLTNYINNLFDDKLSFSFDFIPIITSTDLEILKNKLFISEATIEDKMAIKKYYYLQNFKNNSDKDILSFGWNNNYITFFNKIKNIYYDDNNVFDKIKNISKWTSIFPENELIKKVKLDDDIINQIFNEFHFKSLNKSSNQNYIIKNLYNAYFNKNIIKSEIDDHKHSILSIDDKIRKMYNFGLLNLNLSNKNLNLFLDY
jgi:hypothetical protein